MMKTNLYSTAPLANAFKTQVLLLLMLLSSVGVWGQTTILTEDFSSITEGDNTTSTGSSNAWAGNLNFPDAGNVKAYQALGAVKIGTTSLIGTITSKIVNLSTDGGNVKVTFDVKGWTTVEGDIRVTITGQTAKTVIYTAVMAGTFETKTVSFTGGAAGSTVKIETTAKRAFIDNVKIETIASGKTVTFNSNGGSGSMANQTASIATNLNANTFTRTGYTFSGWNTAANNSGTAYANNASYPFTADATLYAQWNPNYDITFANLQFLDNHSIKEGSTITAYGQVYAAGLTNVAGQGALITTEFGYSTSNTNPNTWTNWVSGTYSSDVGNNDEYKAVLGTSLTPGTYYIAARYKYGSEGWIYGGFNTNTPTAGGIWNGGANYSDVLTITSNKVSFGNFQYPTSGSVNLGGSYNVYGQTYEAGVTTSPGGGGVGITADVAFSAANTNPSTWSAASWNAAAFNRQDGNNFEYIYDIGTKFTTGGNFYMAFRYKKTGSTEYVYGGTGGNWSTDSATITVTAPPTITTSGTLSSLSTIYGTASTNTTFTVSADNLTANLIITPPTGFEVSTSAGSGFTTSLNLGSGTRTNTTIYVRIAATTAVGNYNGNVSLTSSGATTVNIATNATNTVNKKALTITGLSGNNKIYDALTTATATGTATLNGILFSDVVNLAGTPSYNFANKTIGTGKAITVSGFTLTGANAGNYSVTQPTGLTGNITPKNLTVTGATAQNKVYDGTTVATITGSTLIGIISGDVVTISGGGTFASANVNTGIAVTASLSLSGVDSGNYTFAQPTGLSADITKATPVFTTSPISVLVGGTYALPGANISSTSNGTLSYSITGGGKATLSGTTITGIAAGSETLTVNQMASGNYGAGSTTIAVIVNSCTPPIWEENFDYGLCDNLNLPDLTSNWVRFSGSTSDAQYYSNGLVYSGYPSSGVGGAFSFETGGNDDIKREISSTGINSGSVFASFLVNMNDNTSTSDDYFLSLIGDPTVNTLHGRIYIKKDGTQYRLGVGKQSSSGSAADINTSLLNFDQTYLVVVKYEFIAGGTNDPFKLWVFSTGVPASEATAGTFITATLSGTDANNIRSFAIRQTNKAKGFVDGIRVATSWDQLFCGTEPTSKTYTWTGTNSSSWSDAGNWSPSGVPAGIDNVIINTPGVHMLNITDCRGIKDFTLNGTGVFSASASGVFTINGNITYGSTASAALDCASKVFIKSASSQPIPPLTYGNLDALGGTRVFSPTGTIKICGGFNVDPTKYFYTIAGSTVEYISPATGWVMTPFTYNNLTFSGTGDFSIGYSNPVANKTITVEGDYLQSAGKLILGETSSRTATLNVTGNMTLTGGTFEMNATSGGKGIVNLNGDLSVGTSAVLSSSTTTLANTNFNFSGTGDGTSAASTQTIDIKNAGTAGYIIFNVNNAAYAKLINQDFFFGTNSKFNVKTGAILDFGFNGNNPLNLIRVSGQTGQAFAAQSGSTLKITSPLGITLGSTPDYTGNVQIGSTAANRLFDPAASYHYIGKTNQVSGNGLPAVTGKVIVEMDTPTIGFQASDNTRTIASGGTLEIRQGIVTDDTTHGFNGAGKLTMNSDNGRYIVNQTGTQPSLTGAYALTGGTVEFGNTTSSAFIRVTPRYYNVDVSGTNIVSGGQDFFVKNVLNLTKNNAVLNIPASADSSAPNVVTATNGLKVTNGATMHLLNNANLIQDAAASNTGKILVDRIAKLPANGYNYWSSPVSGQAILGDTFSPGTPDNRIFSYRESNDRFYPTGDTSFISGKGYAIRGTSATAAAAGKIFNFMGAPNNGDLSTPSLNWTDADHGYNLIGNPYPSNLDFNAFCVANALIMYNTAYFWTNNTYTPTQEGSAYSGVNYAIMNGTGSTPAGYQGTSAGPTPTNYIKPGQAFVIQMKSAAALSFTNAMRVPSAGVFYNNKNSNLGEKDRFHLTLTTPSQINNVLLIGYVNGATDNYEKDYDAELIIEGSDSFYSKLNSVKLAIQGKQYPLVNSDVVYLGAVYYESGLHKISLNSKEGIFETDQNVYLKDKTLNIVTNLSERAYEFTALQGVDQNRFEIIYKPEGTLATQENGSNSLNVYRDGQDFIVSSSSKIIDEVEVIDVSGRLLQKVKGNSTKVLIEGNTLVSGFYILKIKRNNEIISKKIIK